MLLRAILRIFAYGTSEGVEKSWESRQRKSPSTVQLEGERRPAASGIAGHYEQTHVLREGNPGQSWSGLGTTGTKEATNQKLKLDYFLKTNGFSQVGTTKDAGQMGYYAGRLLSNLYRNGDGESVKVFHDTALHRVTADVSGPKETHDELDKTMARKDVKKLSYELAARQWVNDPRRTEIALGAR